MSDERLAALMVHAEWADAAMWRAVLGAEAATMDDRILNGLHHIHAVQRAFRNVWVGEDVDFSSKDEVGNARAICDWGREGHGWVREVVAASSPADLDRICEIPWAHYFEDRFGRKMAPVRMRDTVEQVAMHSSHHRGQVATRLRELQVDPPMTDYIGWLWFDRPAVEWP